MKTLIALLFAMPILAGEVSCHVSSAKLLDWNKYESCEECQETSSKCRTVCKEEKSRCIAEAWEWGNYPTRTFVGIGESTEEAAESALGQCQLFAFNCHISYCGQANVTISKVKCSTE